MTTAVQTPPIAQFSFRRSILESEKRFRLFPTAIAVDDENREPFWVPLSGIHDVHLRLFRTRNRDYYQCRIRSSQAPDVFLQHVHFRAPLVFEDRRGAYTPFVRALLAALAPHAGRVRLHSGSFGTFIGSILATVVMAAILGVALLLQWWLVSVLAAIVLWRVATLIGRSRPRHFTPDAPPPGLLPE